MQILTNAPSYTAPAPALSTWTPRHHALAAAAAELSNMAERDAAFRRTSSGS